MSCQILSHRQTDIIGKRYSRDFCPIYLLERRADEERLLKVGKCERESISAQYLGFEYLCGGKCGQVVQGWKAANGQFANLRGGETAANSGPLSTQGALLSHPPSSAVKEEHGE